LARHILVMSNRQLTDLLSAQIIKDYTWRIKELAALKNKIPKKESETQKILIRSGIVMLYANWEGFVKYSANEFYQHVRKQRYKNEELHSCFVAMSLSREIEELLSTKKIVNKSNAVNFLRQKMRNRAHLPSTNPIRTSNLRYDVFEEVITILGLDRSNYELRKNFINKKLVDNRNTIAHGNFLKVNYDTFLDIYKGTMDLLNRYKNDVLNSAILKTYRITPP